MNDSLIGFIGLGNVGSKIANNILINGYKLYVHDLDAKKSQNLQNFKKFPQIFQEIVQNFKSIQYFSILSLVEKPTRICSP